MLENPNPQISALGENREPPLLLIVDDNPAVLRTMADMVENLGYRAVTAPNGEEALELLAKPNTIALVLTDVVMPGKVNGIELANEIGANFHIPTVLATGSPRHRFMRDMSDQVDLLLKPFSIDQLDQRISASLTAH